jgi:lysophospholipase
MVRMRANRSPSDAPPVRAARSRRPPCPEAAMQLIDHELNPVPDGAVAGYVKAADGTKLRYALFRPKGEAQGTVVLVQGRAEFIEKYFETVRDLLVRRFAVVTFDLRGQGGSERLLSNPAKGHVTDFADYVADLDAVLDQVVFTDCPTPVFALGHSTGATVLLLASVGGRSRFRRQVLLSPFLGLPDDRAHDTAARVFTTVARGLGFGRLAMPTAGSHIRHAQSFETNRLTGDATRYARNAALAAAHPELVVTVPTIAWINAALASIARIDAEDFAPRIRVPGLIVAGGNDRIVSLAAIERFASRFKVGHLIVIAGARHELLQEREPLREQLLAAFDAFVPGT